MSASYRLVNMNILPINEPIRASARKTNLCEEFVMHQFQSCIIIGLKDEQLTILTNQKMF